MKFAILGSGAVGGYYGAKLARAGHDVTFIARGAHLAAIRERGLRDPQPDARRLHRPRQRGGGHGAGSARSTSCIVAVKAYDNAPALPMICARCSGRDTTVLTLQNGVDSAGEVAAVAGEAHVARRHRPTSPPRSRPPA